MNRLFAHQKNASNVLDNVNSLALFYEAGTGKTMCILDWVYRHANDGDLEPESVLILCPASVVPMWERAINNLQSFEGYTDKGVQNARKSILLASFGKIYLSHKTQALKGGKTYRTLKPEYDRHWSLIAVDESHSIGSHSAIRTKMCLSLAKKQDKRVILTGTPISGGGGKGDYQKLYGQMLFLDYDAFGMHGTYTDWCSWTQWKKKYVTQENYFGAPTQYDEPALNEIMKKYALVVRLDDCYDIPSSQDIDIPVFLQGKGKEYYGKLAKQDPMLTPTLEVELNIAGSRYVKMYEITSGFIKPSKDGEIVSFDTPRLPALRNIIEGTDDKVVVFCHFTHSVDECYRACSEYGKTVIMDGRSDKDAWVQFQDGDQKYIVCQYQSGGVGIDLYASHTCVFYEPTMSSLLLEQARQRIRRKGQNKRCLYYHITTSGCIDVRISDTVRSGVDVTNKLLDDWAKEELK